MSKLTLDEAIAQVRKNASDSRQEVILGDNLDLSKQAYNEVCIEFAEEQERIAELLEELKMLRELKDEHRKIGNIEGYNKGYSKAENDYHGQSEKDRQTSYDCGYEVGYSKAIDDCYMKAKTLINEMSCRSERMSGRTHIMYFIQALEFLRQVAKELKAGVKND